ncbi:MAG: BamA/TamA family outer membrane protein, partial [Phaeodactylibacter sp.]|nr:BamA/TamA family outer membrane protein [Phaeodactylibacter sp.]
NFMGIARKYYELMASEVDIVGTFKRDLFVIERMEDGRTRVRAYDTNSKFEKELKFYDRTFLPDETKEIAIYGLTDEDVFQVEGSCKKNCIKVRMIGGVGKDILEDESNGKGLIYYDARNEGNLLQTGSKAKIKRRFDPTFNTYDRESKDYNFNFASLMPAAGFNPDDGILLGLTAAYTTFGFKKAPYAAQHRVDLKFAAGTNGFNFNYRGEFIDLFGPYELGIDASYQTPLYSRNFYGLGNESINIEEQLDDEALNFNRIKQREISIMPSIMRRINANSRVLIGPTFESIEVERTTGRFIDEVGNQFQEELFEGLEFAGARFLLDYNTRDNNAIPSRGLGFFLETGWKQQLKEGRKNYGYLNTAFTAYQRIDRQGKLVFATRVEFQHRFNEDYEFYQGATLGGPGHNANFRGFRRDRFIGSTAFVHNSDLRWKALTSQNKTLPFSFGFMGGFDHGRVWLRGEDSDVWHYSYGGGIWLSPFDIFVLSGGVYRGDNENNRVVVTGGFFF